MTTLGAAVAYTVELYLTGAPARPAGATPGRRYEPTATTIRWRIAAAGWDTTAVLEGWEQQQPAGSERRFSERLMRYGAFPVWLVELEQQHRPAAVSL